MSANPKRRWYQFSLRALFVVLTGVGLLLGCRGLYFEAKANYHADKAARIMSKADRIGGHVVLNLVDIGKVNDHEALAQWYRYAARRPWMVVDESLILPEYPKNRLKKDK